MADYQERLAEFREKGVDIVAASVETEAEAKETVEKLGLDFPVAYGIDPVTFAKTTGAYYAKDEDGDFLHATGFMLKPDNTIDVAVFSSGAIGRLEVGDALQFVEFRLKND